MNLTPNIPIDGSGGAGFRINAFKTPVSTAFNYQLLFSFFELKGLYRLSIEAKKVGM